TSGGSESQHGHGGGVGGGPGRRGRRSRRSRRSRDRRLRFLRTLQIGGSRAEVPGARQDPEQDDELLAGEDQGEIAEFLAVPDGTEKQPDEERKEAEGAEKDLERQRADGPPEDEPEAAHQRGERIRDSLAQSRARVEDDEPDISGHEEEGAESEKQKPGGRPERGEARAFALGAETPGEAAGKEGREKSHERPEAHGRAREPGRVEETREGRRSPRSGAL